VPVSGFDPRLGRDYEYSAFLPDPLPGSVELDQATWIVVAEAMAALGRLDQAGVLIPNPTLLRRPLLRREAVSTSALEGTHAAFADVMEAGVADESAQAPEVREVLNYVFAAEFALAEIRDGRPISTSLLSAVQEMLVRGTKDEGPETGKIRTTQVLIGSDGCAIGDARFVPPPPDARLRAATDDWAAWLEHESELPIVVQAALAHYQFETLHPFHDGNGRIGRLVVLLHLVRGGDLREPLLEISPWFERRKRDYQDHLLEVSTTGDWNRWVRFFCAAIRDQAEDTVHRINELLRYQAEVRALLRSEKVRGVAVAIAEELIGQPVVTASWAARQHGVTFAAANNSIARLVKLGVLREATGRGYGRMFRSDNIFDVLNK
jgi:Fic family protein